MGAGESNSNVQMQSLGPNSGYGGNIQGIIQSVFKSRHKPNPSYAKLATQKPRVPRLVQIIMSKYSNSLNIAKPKQSVQNLPLYEMVSLPGIYYKGDWFGGKQHGQGQVFTRSGIYFHGEFVNGVARCRDGIMIFPDGSFYRGNFDNNCFNGQGILRHEDFIRERTGSSPKFMYEGNWSNNRPQGYGKQIYHDKSTYEGDFKNGKKHGKGTFTWQTGKIYHGDFYQGHMHGRGKLTFQESSVEGTFSRGQLTKAQGHVQTMKGRYFGQYKHGMMHDPDAVFVWNDGKQYRGGFKLGQLHGRGRLIYPNKQVIEGQWKDGQNVQITSIKRA